MDYPIRRARGKRTASVGVTEGVVEDDSLPGRQSFKRFKIYMNSTDEDYPWTVGDFRFSFFENNTFQN